MSPTRSRAAVLDFHLGFCENGGSMEIWQVLLDVVILLGAGALLGALFERFRQSAIIGYLVAGVLLGPNALHVVQSREEVLAVSELGVALLLFAIGLEFSWTRLRSMGRIALGSGALQVAGTTVVGWAVARMAGLGNDTALTLGAVGALSSTACVLRVLTARGEVQSIHGERAVGILLVQDLAVVPLVLLVSVLTEGGTPSELVASLARMLVVSLLLIARALRDVQQARPAPARDSAPAFEPRAPAADRGHLGLGIRYRLATRSASRPPLARSWPESYSRSPPSPCKSAPKSLP